MVVIPDYVAEEKMIFQNLYKRGFPMQLGSSAIKNTPTKRKQSEAIISPLKRLNLGKCLGDGDSSLTDNSTPTNSQTASKNKTPVKRKLSVLIEPLQSTLKRLNIASIEKAQFKVPQIPQPNKKKGAKIFTRVQLGFILGINMDP